MEPGMHTQPHLSTASPSPYAQSESSWQQYPQNRTDTAVGSFNNSAADPSNKSALAAVTASSRGPSYEVLCTVSPHSSGTAPVQHLCATQAQQSQAPHLRTSPTGRCSPQSFVASTSMTSSSVGDACNLGLNRQPSYRSEAYGSQHQNSLGHHSQQQPNNRQRNAPPQPLDQHSSDVVDTVSRSLNTHNDPELEELSPMHHGNESEDEMVGHATDVAEAAGHATALYSEGFLISTSSVQHPSASQGNDGGGTYIPSHLYDGKEQQPSRDDGEAATSQASRSRGPLAITTAAGISHRLLTTDEINERRRVSRAASRSVSQVQSAVAGPAIDENAGSHTSSVNPRLGIQTTNSNLNTPSGVCKGNRPAHRRLTKEEADQLIAHRQQQQTADTATVAAVAAAVTDIASPSKQQQQQHHQQQQQQQHELSSSLANISHNNNHSGASHSAPLDSAQPWLLSEEGPQSNYFTPAPASTLQPASTSTMGSGGGSTLTKPMALEWLRGTHGGRTGAGGGAGFLAESTVHSCPGGNGWCDSNVAGNHVSGGNVNIKTTMTAFLGATGGAAGDGGSNGDSNTSAGTLTGAGQAPGSASTTGFTWLPNTSNWSPHHQPPLQGLSPSVPAAPLQFGSSGGTTNAATWGHSNTSIGFPSGSLRSGSLTFLSSPTPAALHGMSHEAIEERIGQCDSQLEQLRQEREQLVQELQRRLYAAAKGEKPQHQSHNYIDAVGWPGALNPNTVAIPSSAMGTVTARTSMPPRGTATAGSGSSGGGGGAARQRPIWPFLGDFVMNGDGVANALPRGLVDTRKPPGPCTEPTVEVVSEEWLRSAPAAAAGHQWPSSGSVSVVQSAHQAATDTSAVGGSVGNWTAEERSGNHGRRRAETGKQRKKNDGNNNGASSSAGTRATASNTGGGGHSASHRCSHDNTPQEEKYLQTDPFSMYMHNKKIVTPGAATPKSSSRGRHGDR